MHANYTNPVLRQLRDQQVRFAPRDQQLEQANRAEKLLAEIDPVRLPLRISVLSDYRLPPHLVPCR